jgi:hypothetical protein
MIFMVRSPSRACDGRDLGSELELDDNYPISTDE